MNVKEIVADMAKNNQLDGMSKKEARKYIQADLREQMAKATHDGTDKLKMKDYKKLAQAGKEAAIDNATTKWAEARANYVN